MNLRCFLMVMISYMSLCGCEELFYLLWLVFGDVYRNQMSVIIFFSGLLCLEKFIDQFFFSNQLSSFICSYIRGIRAKVVLNLLRRLPELRALRFTDLSIQLLFFIQQITLKEPLIMIMIWIKRGPHIILQLSQFLYLLIERKFNFLSFLLLDQIIHVKVVF